MNHTAHNPTFNVIQTPDLQIIRKPQALTMLGISKSNFHNKINAGLLPKAITLGANSKGYFKHEITAVLVAMATDKNQDEIKTLVKFLINQRHYLVT
jgi:predicted DNA-binding transcriptional regulator AlpA